MNNRDLATTTSFRKESSQPVIEPAINYGDQIPTPEPRKKTLINLQNMSIRRSEYDNTSNTKATLGQTEDLHKARLVTVKHRHEIVGEDDSILNNKQYYEASRCTSFHETPQNTDEGVESPTNIEYDYEEEEEEEEPDRHRLYGDDDDDDVDDDDDDDEELSEKTDELTDLSRQSMMPLHELIAYYQYIQQGHNGLMSQKEIVSQQSSCDSQQSAKLRDSHKLEAEVKDTVDALQSRTESCISPDNIAETEDLNTSIEAPINQVIIPKLQVEHVDGNSKVTEESINDIKITDNNISALPPAKNKRRIRANVILELINSERDFVKHLKDVVEGYLYPARRHPEIFTGERISTIFSNIEQLYEFQRQFLDSLESCICWDDLAESEVGHCFLDYENGFSVYHYYCNNHPNAISELQELYTKPRFVKFFEACRLLQNMIDISLDGFLLTPIQKICKYPLQLNELLKNTDNEHPDFHPVANALESMRNCANLANERKRRIEALADVMSLQEKLENWFGPKLSDTSSILIHSGEVSKLKSHTWSQGVQLYLLDHLLLYCKKDLLKRNSLILKGRICTDTVTEVSNADEYKSKKSFKLFCNEMQKWFVFTTRSEKEKNEWLRAFERERSLVESDEVEGFHITEREIGVARRALQNRKHSRSARYRHKRPDTAIVDQLDIDDANTIMNRTLSLPSCIHPSHVMNFVEESRVVSASRKKNTSPQNLSSSRSPKSSCQLLIEQENQQQSSGSWFRKMGSKKFAKSQIYNVNGNGNSGTKQQTSISSSGVLVDSPTTKYDLLEKRYREHMVSEEQARLFRLNNDVGPSLFPPKVSHSSLTNNRARFSPSSGHSQQPGFKSEKKVTTPTNPVGDSKFDVPNERIQNTMSTQGSSLVPASCLDEDSSLTRAVDQNLSTSFTTVMLACGRIVTVREDAV